MPSYFDVSIPVPMRPMNPPPTKLPGQRVRLYWGAPDGHRPIKFRDSRALQVPNIHYEEVVRCFDKRAVINFVFDLIHFAEGNTTRTDTIWFPDLLLEESFMDSMIPGIRYLRLPRVEETLEYASDVLHKSIFYLLTHCQIKAFITPERILQGLDRTVEPTLFILPTYVESITRRDEKDKIDIDNVSDESSGSYGFIPLLKSLDHSISVTSRSPSPLITQSDQEQSDEPIRPQLTPSPLLLPPAASTDPLSPLLIQLNLDDDSDSDKIRDPRPADQCMELEVGITAMKDPNDVDSDDDRVDTISEIFDYTQLDQARQLDYKEVYHIDKPLQLLTNEKGILGYGDFSERLTRTHRHLDDQPKSAFSFNLLLIAICSTA